MNALPYPDRLSMAVDALKLRGHDSCTRDMTTAEMNAMLDEVCTAYDVHWRDLFRAFLTAVGAA